MGPSRKRPIGPALPGCFRPSPLCRRLLQMGEAQYLPLPAFGESRGRSPLAVLLFCPECGAFYAVIFLLSKKKKCRRHLPLASREKLISFLYKTKSAGVLYFILEKAYRVADRTKVLLFLQHFSSVAKKNVGKKKHPKGFSPFGNLKSLCLHGGH